ncbi:heme exporter protein D [Actinobacillus ureae]|uniref:Heme exporter protein D n=1 Tax=Actinobacillus ureae ATCC 25976 TaxID=887324 RepID=E8KKA0_9PAST|nr:heme exporter protein CcmD [Actinobacillus ureae]EFX90678.1 heme exporter protein CcmD [Actinobacillus ureae ATCC 25976]SUT87559.1 heme exporter protein D [Actinobacillus ureae]SUU49081.1 heme exporter protein D [Actinobacillus ureae]
MQFQFESLSDFLSMGNYGFYVWLSYAVSIIAMGGLIWFSRREEKQIMQQIKKELAREAQLNKK